MPPRTCEPPACPQVSRNKIGINAALSSQNEQIAQTSLVWLASLAVLRRDGLPFRASAGGQHARRGCCQAPCPFIWLPRPFMVTGSSTRTVDVQSSFDWLSLDRGGPCQRDATLARYILLGVRACTGVGDATFAATVQNRTDENGCPPDRRSSCFVRAGGSDPTASGFALIAR